MTRVFLKENVWDAALSRVRAIYDAFDDVAVSFSGGKDSTVCLHLALKVAAERGRLPVPVLWVDQEAEWQTVSDYIRTVMNRPDVKPLWFQGPFKMSNSTTTGADPWLYCWREGDEWIRPKEPNSIHVNETGTDRFRELFTAIPRWLYPDRPLAFLCGVRCEESPQRMNGLTGSRTYKAICPGKCLSKSLRHWTYYPIYDWSFRDVWHAIEIEGWPYCRLYDLMYQRGLHMKDMRVSNVHHETAIHSLEFLQEIEPQTWDKVLRRVAGVNAVKMAKECYACPKELPPMFASWREYRDHLLENITEVAETRDIFRRHFAAWEKVFNPDVADEKFRKAFYKMCIDSILVNDYEGTKYGAFYPQHNRRSTGYGKATLRRKAKKEAAAHAAQRTDRGSQGLSGDADPG